MPSIGRSLTTPLRRLTAFTSHLPNASPRLNPITTRTMASIPQTMKGISIDKTGGIEVLNYKTDLPVPSPKDGEVLIKNDYTGINFIDTYFRTGLYPPPSFPYVLGKEPSGSVVSVGSGETHGIKPGDRVAAFAASAYSEYSVAPALHTYKLPDSIDTKTGAAALLQGLTALTLIRDAHHVHKGDWVLVTAAAGGMGLWLCQLLKAVGAKVIGTASTPEKRELAKKMGATEVLEYHEKMGHEEFVKKVKELTGGEGVPAVFDGVGAATFDVCLDCVARKGSMISYGNASGAVPPFKIARLSAKNVRLMRPTLFNFINTREEFAKNAEDMFELMKENNIDVRVHKVYDLKDAAQAQSDLEGRKTTGKLLLKC